MNITEDYNSLKTYYNVYLNTDQTLVKTSNDEPTPIECVEEMINKIPEDTWKRDDLKVLDPCCGCGNFFLVILEKLKKYHTVKDILENMLYFNDINEDRLTVVKEIFMSDEYNLNISEMDYLKYDEEMKYDIVVANPPYAKLLSNGKRASKNHNLIGVFIDKTLKILKEGGYMLYITPDNWMTFSDRNTLIKTLTSLQILYINIHIAKKYFKKIGSSFTWYLIENKKSYKDVEIDGIWKGNLYNSTVESQVRRYIPLYYNRIIQSILKKTIDASNTKFKVETSSDLHKYTKKIHISNQKTDEFKYKLIHTPKQTVWANRPHKYQTGYKVFISTTTYYGVFVDNCGMTQSIAFIRCDNKKKANKIKSVLEHPLYVFINNICRYGNFNNIRILQNFPYCDNKEKIYETFKITTEEQNFINNNM